MTGGNRTRKEILKARREIKREYGALFDAVAEILFRHDPAGINFGFNADEYEPEAETILPRLRDCRSADDVERIVREEFRRWFDEETAARPRIGKIAGEIWEILESRRKNDG